MTLPPSVRTYSSNYSTVFNLIDDLKISCEKLNKIFNVFNSEINILKASNELEINNLKLSNEKQMNTMLNNFDYEFTKLKSSHAMEINNLKLSNKKEINIMLNNFDYEFTKLKLEYDSKHKKKYLNLGDVSKYLPEYFEELK